jgi:hypothetical protein
MFYFKKYNQDPSDKIYKHGRVIIHYVYMLPSLLRIQKLSNTFHMKQMNDKYVNQHYWN